MAEIKMVVFDMAGTTVDEDNVVYKTVHQCLVDEGYVLSFEEVLFQAAGKEKRQAIADLVRPLGGNDAEIDRLFILFKSKLKDAYYSLAVTPQAGAEQVFQALKDKSVFAVLNTGYDRNTAESLIKKLGWKEGIDFDLLVTASDVERSRPHPDMIHLAMKRLGIQDGAQVSKVGDSIIDIEEGQQAGCGLVVGITTGAHTQAELESASPDAVVHNLAEFLALL